MKPTHAILLVEDNPADIKITERALRESAMPVQLIVARDGPFFSASYAWPNPFARSLVTISLRSACAIGISCQL